MNDPAIKISALHKGYRNHTVLAGIALEIKAGEYFGIVGMNGAGKTTLIKSLLDFCQIDSGTIRIFGTAHNRTAARNHLAFLPERFNPPYYLTGREFLDYTGTLYGQRYERTEIEAAFRHLDLDLTALSQPVRDYSKGMAQKLGLTACLLSRRALLVLDEPMSGLDPKARALFKAYLQQRRTRISLFFSTHLLNDVESLCDRLAILHEAKICFIGSPRQCCERYQAETLEKAYLAAIGATADLSSAA